MLDIAWPELLVVGAVALVAVGPKDLPRVMHALGVWAGKARRFAMAIQHDFERLAHEAESAEREKRENENGIPPQRHEAPIAQEPVKTEGDNVPSR